MAARSPRYPAATAAAEEVMETADRSISSTAGALWFGNIAGRVEGTCLVKAVNTNISGN